MLLLQIASIQWEKAPRCQGSGAQDGDMQEILRQNCLLQSAGITDLHAQSS